MAPDALHVPLIRPVPVVPGLDNSLRFLADPYRFIARECHRLGSDVVLARLMLQPTLCLTGPRAAEVFYDRARVRRAGAVPEPKRASLFGGYAVPMSGGDPHPSRMRFIVATSGPLAAAALVTRALREWDRLLPRWCSGPRLVLYGAGQEWLARTACAWAGIPLAREEVGPRTAQLAALFDPPAGGLATHLRARLARRDAETWLARLVQDHRRQWVFAEDSPAAAAAELVDPQGGQRLPARLAAAELLNLLRPIVAVSVFVVLAAHALHRHPGWRDSLADGEDRDLEAFVQEVRRFYPFFPAVRGHVRREFVWEGWHFPQGARVMLDLYGTNHDARAWPQPHEFRPERFFGAIPGLFDFVPHGGRADDGPRGPGEGLTLALMKLALRQLALHLRYEVPAQDLDLRMDRPPALPRDRFVVERLVPI